MDDLDRNALHDYFNKREESADDEAMRAYWEGRIDGHCLQNAIDFTDLTALADHLGFEVEWISALQEQA